MPRIKYSATQFSVTIGAKEAAMMARIAKEIEKRTFVRPSRAEVARCSIRAFHESLSREQPESIKVHSFDTEKKVWRELPGHATPEAAQAIKEQS